MNFKIDQYEFSKSMATGIKGISTKNIQPILSGVYIQAIDNQLIIKSTDMEIGVETRVNAQVIEEGSIVIPGKNFLEILRKLPKQEIEFKTKSNNRLEIKYGKAEISLNYLDSEDFPKVQDMEEDISFSVDSGKLSDLIVFTLIAIAKENTRPIFTGLLFEIEDNKMKIVSSDTHRLAYGEIEVINNTSNEKFEVVVPGKVLREIISLKEDDKNFEFLGNKKKIQFKINDDIITSRIIEGKFVNYLDVIPNSFKCEFKVMKNSILSSLERANLLTINDMKSKMNTIKLMVKDNNLIITCNSNEMGEIYEEIPVFKDGENIELGFNSRYLIEMIKNVKCEELNIKLGGALSPGIIEPAEKDNKRFYLILPVRLN